MAPTLLAPAVRKKNPGADPISKVLRCNTSVSASGMPLETSVEQQVFQPISTWETYTFAGT